MSIASKQHCCSAILSNLLTKFDQCVTLVTNNQLLGRVYKHKRASFEWPGYAELGLNWSWADLTLTVIMKHNTMDTFVKDFEKCSSMSQFFLFRWIIHSVSMTPFYSNHWTSGCCRWSLAPSASPATSSPSPSCWASAWPPSSTGSWSVWRPSTTSSSSARCWRLSGKISVLCTKWHTSTHSPTSSIRFVFR